MEEKTKYRVTGVLVLLAILAILIPFFFGNSAHQARLNLSSHFDIPAPPTRPTMESLPKPDQSAVSTAISTSEFGAPVSDATQVQRKATNKITHTVQKNAATDPSGAPVATATAVGAASGYVIQLGTFSSSAHANQLVQRLQDNNFEAYSREIQAGEKTLVKVLVGPFSKHAQANDVMQSLKSTYHLKGLVKPYMPNY